MTFSRVLVANRGEVAVRVIRALHELGIEAVAVYSTADEDATFVRMADRALRIGPPAAASSYLSIPSLIAAATTTGCEAVHPGWGFLAENPAFARACDDNELVFIGPTPDVMERMGDKARAKHELRSAGVPLVPGTEGSATVGQARTAADELGYPVLLKAAAGGGGKGMRLVDSQEELEDAFGAAASEAQAAFGDPHALRREGDRSRRGTSRSRCSRDAHGGVLTLGERECSIQRRHQKLIEESPSPALTPDAREEMEAAAERAVRTIGYRNAGTFEFLVGPDGSFYFIELNARLQVEHPVSELCTGIDIVHEQLRIAAGEPLSRDGPCAAPRARDRDPHQRRGSRSANFAPAPGSSAASGRRSARACASTPRSRTARSSRRTTTR